jgi:hypothetical protein
MRLDRQFHLLIAAMLLYLLTTQSWGFPGRRLQATLTGEDLCSAAAAAAAALFR